MYPFHGGTGGRSFSSRTLFCFLRTNCDREWGTVVPIPTCEKDDFRLTPEALKSHITEKTKLLVLPFPNNPTGGIMHREDLEAIAEVLRDTNIMVLSDEIYAELTYGGKHVSIASIEGMRNALLSSMVFPKPMR